MGNGTRGVLWWQYASGCKTGSQEPASLYCTNGPPKVHWHPIPSISKLLDSLNAMSEIIEDQDAITHSSADRQDAITPVSEVQDSIQGIIRRRR